MMTETQFAKTLLDVIPPLVRMIRSEIRGAAPGVLTVPQFRALANISRGLNTVSEIAEHHGVSQPAMTKMVNGLVKRGLVRRKTNQEDVRQILLTLTPKGKSLHKSTWNTAQKSIGKRLRSIPPKERSPLIQALLTLRSAL